MTDDELKADFWKALKSDRTMMLGLVGVDQSHTRPMTALLEDDDGGPIWFFTASDCDLAKSLEGGAARGFGNFASKGHDVFAALNGQLSEATSREMIDKLWNPFVGAWYESKDDPKIRMLRFDAEEAQIWGDASSMLAGIKMLLGIDPKKEFKDKVATVSLD